MVGSGVLCQRSRTRQPFPFLCVRSLLARTRRGVALQLGQLSHDHMGPEPRPGGRPPERPLQTACGGERSRSTLLSYGGPESSSRGPGTTPASSAPEHKRAPVCHVGVPIALLRCVIS
ncbi:hypothetical protein EYF80_035169 [Liparis tanakae]|uniref:Uncharacterized protein n=1 Tax=Liparis tanakae TaxID=230148 RepID=A0A4Z2GM21_9TELE|nr:hypothetical protein EYF80_035169 [Liparis tanakae]